jgi:hypothetical protein
VIRIHFPRLDPQKELINIAAAMRVGGSSGAKAGDGPERNKFDKLNEQIPRQFELSDLEHADLLIYPHLALRGPELAEVAEAARQRNIGCLFFSWGDADQKVDVPYGTVYRHSLFSDRREPFELAPPAEVSDPTIELQRPIVPREKSEVPVVGFCGFVSNPLMRSIYRLTGRQRKVEGLQMRALALSALRRTRGLKTNFITRQSYWAGTRGRFHNNVAAEFKPRQAFWQNVFDSDYTLCIRGAGNFSYRFYEVLAAGRIPLFINTRCVLPFDNEIDWKKHCVWVEEADMGQAGEKVKQFHARLSPAEFRDLQLANRRLWEEKLSPSAFYTIALTRAAASPAAR